MSTTMVTGEGTNLIDHNHQIPVMLENYQQTTDDSDTTGVLKTQDFYYLILWVMNICPTNPASHIK